MVATASIVATFAGDSIPYSLNAVLPTSEADIFNGVGISARDPLPVLYAAAAIAAVGLSVSGSPASNQSYVILQTDLMGTWIDLATCTWSDTSGSATFLLCAGAPGGACAFRAWRAADVAPQGTESVPNCPLGGRVRFVGKAVLTGGTSPQVTATVNVKLMGLR
jgi:hypothetical protein